VRAGRAEEISESRSVALVAATKGSGGPPDRVQPHSSTLASRRAWALRPAFLRSVLERSRTGRQFAIEVSTTLADGALRTLSAHIDSTIGEVESSLGRAPTRAKHRAKLVVDAAIAAAGGPTSAELLERGVDVRAVVVDETSWPYEAMSFPAFRYQELIREDWEQSELLARLDRFLFVPIVADQGLGAIGQGVIRRPFLWVPSESDLGGMAREWTMYRDEVEAGMALQLTPAKRTHYLHVRPKGKTGLDTDPAPKVGQVVKKCFWFNKALMARIMGDAAG
jgi:DNA mismatch repair protein MutH